MKLSDKGKQLIITFEGVSLRKYRDVAGKWTIGVGHLIKDNETFPDLITEEEARRLLTKDTMSAQGYLNSIKLDLSQNEYDALVSLIFNIGLGHFKESTVLRKLKEGDKEGAAKAFHMWKKAGGKVIDGLLVRRIVESIIFLGDSVKHDFITEAAKDLKKRHKQMIPKIVSDYFKEEE